MSKVKVFISWSKPRSRAVGEALRDWLPNVIQNLDTWMSAADIDKGAKWRQVLNGELATANFGIICLTPENLKEPWLLFEAGALSKTAESRVCTYLYDLEFTEVKDPLSEFQHTSATKEDTRALVRSINAIMSEHPPESRIDRAFDVLWPEFESVLRGIKQPTEPAEEPNASVALPGKEMLKEVLLTVRELARDSRALLDHWRTDPTRSTGYTGPATTPIPPLFWTCPQCGQPVLGGQSSCPTCAGAGTPPPPALPPVRPPRASGPATGPAASAPLPPPTLRRKT
jgi:hypothetical protein